MNSKIILAIAAMLMLMTTVATAFPVAITGTSDSRIRPYLEQSYGSVPSAGHYTYWSVYVQKETAGWTTVQFKFDSGIANVTVYAVPNHRTYVYATGYQKQIKNVKVGIRGTP